MQTLKIPYQTSQENLNLIKEYQKQYSSCLHFMYNRVKDDYSETEIKHLQINNIELLDSWFKQSCVKEAEQIYSKSNKVIFGGKKNYFDRLKGNITKEQFKENKLSAIYSIGTRSCKTTAGNLKFNLTNNLNLIFKPNRKTKIELYLKYRNKHLLTLLYLNQETRKFSLTYKLDQKFVYITFNETQMNNQINLNKIQNRVLGIDMNPNYIGWSIVDWKTESEFKIIKSGIYSIKTLNDKDFSLKGKGYSNSSKERVYIFNKRNYENIQIVINIINKAIYYKCQMVSIENLNIKSSDKKLGNYYNKLVNNSWNRNQFVNNLIKRCNIFNIKLLKVKPEYSSFIGNFLYRSLKLPDMILASIEIGRRGYEFYNQYITKTKEIKKNIVQPDIKLFNEFYIKSLEEFNIKMEQFKDLVEIYYFLKKAKCKYRLSIDQFNLESKIQFSRKSLIYKLFIYYF